ncbi:MAG TPA: hypothetical protein ENK55_05890 [Actinobacteria bacterium]|nr:hypothetical protein [Actinomycetota bacterium]
MTDRTKLLAGIALVVVGLVTAGVAAFVVHAAEAPPFDDLGRELYPWAPRLWQVAVAAKLVSLGGILLAMGGLALAVVYERPLTWARAAVGAFLFVGLFIIFFGIVPNEFLNIAQSVWEWTPTKVFVTIPPWLVLGNEVSISYAALKDMISGGYSATVLVVGAVAMVKWQERDKDAGTKPTPVSDYGRPVRVEG